MSLADVKLLLESEHEASLGTLKNGKPYVSAIGFVYQTEEPAGKIFILMSDLAQHAKNLKQDPSAGLLITESGSGPIHERKRVSLEGAVQQVQDTVLISRLTQLYLAAFPKSGIFFQLPDFRFYGFTISQAHWIGGFGQAESIYLEN